MKKLILTLLLTAGCLVAAVAQNYMVVNTQKVFQAMPDYQQAVAQIDTLAAQYQRNIDRAYEVIEQMYNQYQDEKETLTPSVRQSREEAILVNEQKVTKYQEEVFGQQGTLMEKRVATIKPIQDKVFKIINEYAEKNGFDLVLDIASNATILYYTPAADRTEQIINLIK